MPWFVFVLASLAQGLAFDMHENGPPSETVLIIAPPHWRIGPGHVGDTAVFLTLAQVGAASGLGRHIHRCQCPGSPSSGLGETLGFDLRGGKGTG